MKKFVSLFLAGAMLLSAPLSLAESAEKDAKAALVADVAEAVRQSIGYDRDSAYSSMNWKSIADTLPAKFDLRSRGIVPPVHSQESWGNCWSFAAIAACETSQLTSLGWTVDEFKEKTGYDMDLSERHLAWFGTGHLPTLDKYPEGEYPYEEGQAGEGTWVEGEDENPNAAHFSGGALGFASSIFANGTGPELEADWPYRANDGTGSTASDWSIPEEARYSMEAEMLNSAILPSPAERDADGAYVYNPAATEAIKEELLAGRGVSIQYHADQNMSPDSMLHIAVDQMTAQGVPEEVAVIEASLALKIYAPADMTLEQKKALMAYYLLATGTPEAEITDEAVDKAVEEDFESVAGNIYNPPAQTEEEQTEEEAEQEAAEEAEQEANNRALYERLGIDYEKAMAQMDKIAEANAGVYISAETYAQYVDNELATQNHGVTIIGWDDDYAVSNFPADHQPPAPGAWIVRNSWGEGYGVDGYFYLSYYDRTIGFAETFEFVFDPNASTGVNIDTYDSMEVTGVNSVKSEAAVSMANVFPIEKECVLSYVSVMTTELNTQVTANVYLLNEGYTSPTDGVLLETVTDDYKFAGYHRISLDYDYKLPAGSVISIVERQRVDTADGARYALSYTNGTSKELSDLAGQGSWSVGIINEGESFVGIDGQWYDWKDFTDEVKGSSAAAELAEFDNLNIKAYLYNLEGVEAAHNFSTLQVYGGSDALICDDCGEMMLVVR